MDSDPNNPKRSKRLIPETTALIYSRLHRETRLMRFDAICTGLQYLTEEGLLKMGRNCISETSIHKLALSVGVFMNFKAKKTYHEAG